MLGFVRRQRGKLLGLVATEVAGGYSKRAMPAFRCMSVQNSKSQLPCTTADLTSGTEARAEGHSGPMHMAHAGRRSRAALNPGWHPAVVLGPTLRPGAGAQNRLWVSP